MSFAYRPKYLILLSYTIFSQLYILPDILDTISSWERLNPNNMWKIYANRNIIIIIVDPTCLHYVSRGEQHYFIVFYVSVWYLVGKKWENSKSHSVMLWYSVEQLTGVHYLFVQPIGQDDVRSEVIIIGIRILILYKKTFIR